MPDTTTAWIARRIREARDRRGLSQGELAQRLDRTQTAVSYWEAGKRSPGIDDLLAVAEALDIDVSDLIPTQRSRPPIRALLRATAEQVDRADLATALQELVDQAEALPAPGREIEPSARQPVPLARQLLEAAGTSTLPIDVEDIARRCGTLVLRRPFEDALSGLVIELDDRALIAVNDHHSHTRQRFTVAHELGHHLLSHHDRFHIDLGATAEHGTPPGYDWQSERAANEFAAELLMPSDAVREAATHESDAHALARRFKVSEIAMGYRLLNLGLR